MEKVVAVFDLEGTLFRRSSDFINEIRNSQKRGTISRVNIALFNIILMVIFILYKLHIIDEQTMRTATIKRFAAFLKNSSEKEITQRAKLFATKYLEQLRPEMSRILEEHKKNGHITILISGMPQPYVEAIKQDLGIDIAIATERETRNGYYTGQLASVPCFGERRAQALSELVNKLDYEINLGESFAYGDAIFDRYYLGMVGNPIAVYPDKKLAEFAEEHGWSIVN
ncbi:HAD family hydrolase [Chloroflexota bacterium]